MAEKFIRVRLTRIDNLDLNLFDFDHDTTFVVFFMDAKENVYARYGGRDSHDAENRQSLPGLKYTMASVLAMHKRERKDFAPKAHDESKYHSDYPGGMRRGCMHCHQVKEAMNSSLRRSGQWSRDKAWRFPLPENLGFTLEVDRGNVIEKVAPSTPAARIGLQSGDVVQRLNSVPIHSFGDAQFALDRAPVSGAFAMSWRRGDRLFEEKISLLDGWRKTDILWRASMRHQTGSLRVFGTDLSADERKALGLSPKQLAFRQWDSLSGQAKKAGVRAGDIILGLDDLKLEMDVNGFRRYVEGHYLIGDRVALNIIRDGKRMNLELTLGR